MVVAPENKVTLGMQFLIRQTLGYKPRYDSGMILRRGLLVSPLSEVCG